MMENHSFKLVDSTYQAEDARGVLLSIIQDKINSLNRLCFSMEERGEFETSHYRRRVKELIAMKEEVTEMIDRAAEQGLSFEVDATINVKVFEPAI